MGRVVALAGGIVALHLLGSLPLSAQVRGRVVDPDNHPVAEATVELWGPLGRLASTSSSEVGNFLFTIAAQPPLVVFVRKIGFLPSRVTVSGTQLVVVQLRPRQSTLAALTVRAENLPCVTSNNRQGRQLWDAARRQYGPPPLVVASYPGGGRQLLLTVRGDGKTSTANVSQDSLGILDTSALREATTWRLGMPALARDARHPGEYYGPARRGPEDERFLYHSYPLLDSYEAFHFTDTLFGRWNRLGAPSVDRGNLVVPFCSQHERDEPYVTGTLVFTPESTLASARWRFVTADEVAGGGVWFTPHSTTELLPPLAAIGLFWRRRDGDVFQQWTLYDQWYVCPPAEGDRCREGRAIGR